MVATGAIGLHWCSLRWGWRWNKPGRGYGVHPDGRDELRVPFAVTPPLPEVDLWATVQGAIDWGRGEMEPPPIYPVDRRPMQLCAHIAVSARPDPPINRDRFGNEIGPLGMFTI